MTERWRKRLRDLDSAGPSEDVFERAKSGPSMPEEAIPRPSASSRLVTAVAAFLVFGLAISVFAIPALRLGGDGAGGSGTGMLLPLWPARTLDDLEALQVRVDDGDKLVAYANDPSETAAEFGRQVLGWPDVQVLEVTSGGDSYPDVYFKPDGTTWEGTPSTVTLPPPEVLILAPWVVQTSGPPTGVWTDTPATPSTGAPSPFRTFTIAGSEDVGYWRPAVQVDVYQPLRGDGVWAVLSADDARLDLDVSPGTRVTEGTRISAGLDYPITMSANLGLHIGTGDCSIDLSPGSWISEGPTHEAAELRVSLPPRDGTGCDQVEPGYAFGAEFESGADSDQDPFAGSSPVVALDAVPVIVEWPEVPLETDAEVTPDSIPSPDQSPSPDETEAPLTWTTYTDPMGWTLDVPETWTTQPFDEFDRVTETGAAFVSGDFGFMPGDAGTVTGLVPNVGEVVLFVWHSEGGPFIPPADDTPLPLAYEGLERTPNGWSMSFRANGSSYSILVKPGEGEESISAEHEDILRRMVESISFERLEAGEIHGLVLPIGPAPEPGSVISWSPEHGSFIAVLNAGGELYGLGPIEACTPDDELALSVDSGDLLISCADGAVAWFASDGSPHPDNPAAYSESVGAFTPIVSWDGNVLISVP